MSLTQASILDPIQGTLPPEIWDNPGDPEPRLKRHVAKFIKHAVYAALEKSGYVHPQEWLNLCLTGSLTTYQYGSESDCDVSLFVNSEKLPEWSRAEMIGIMTSQVDGHIIPGTNYPLQDFVVAGHLKPADLYREGLRSGYDIDAERWIIPPDMSHTMDVSISENGIYIYALMMADKMERLLRYEPDKAQLFWHQIHQKRQRDQAAGKGDFAESNVIYKFLAQRGLFPKLSELTGEHIAAFEWPMPKHNLAWQPGSPGKGFILQDGSVWTWPTQNMKPIHNAMAVRAKMEGAQPVKRGTEFHIEPHGRVWQYNRPGDPKTRVFDPDDRFNIMKSNAGLWFGQPGDENPPNVVDDGYGHATGIMDRVGALDHQGVLDANAGQDLQRLPGPVNVPGIGPLQFHSNGDIQRIANEYNQANNLGSHPTDYVHVNPDSASRIAREYERMQHTPNDPQTQQAYQALAREVRAQYDHAVNNGYQFEFYPDHDPYPNSPREAVLDLHHNKHMYVYPTESGYGQEGEDPQDHPLLGDSGVRWNGQPVTHNDLFRAIHDFYGHAKEGLGFRADGEDNAYRQHQAMFSPLARRALASETRGQNSWVNYGPHGQQNQTAGQGDTTYASQKAGLMPEWTTNPNLHTPNQTFARVASSLAEQVVNDTITNGGTTISLDGMRPEIGFVFSISPENEVKVPRDTFTPDVVNDYVVHHQDVLRQPGRYLGTWENEGIVYIDVSQVEPDQQQAYNMAAGANQLAMYDLSNFNEIPISPEHRVVI